LAKKRPAGTSFISKRKKERRVCYGKKKDKTGEERGL